MFETKEDTQGPEHPPRRWSNHRSNALAGPARPTFLHPDPRCAQISLARSSVRLLGRHIRRELFPILSEVSLSNAVSSKSAAWDSKSPSVIEVLGNYITRSRAVTCALITTSRLLHGSSPASEAPAQAVSGKTKSFLKTSEILICTL